MFNEVQLSLDLPDFLYQRLLKYQTLHICDDLSAAVSQILYEFLLEEYI